MTSFHYETILSTLEDGGVRIISLNRPGSLNAMNRALIDDVARAFNDANACDATKAIVFTGEGRAFCAGDDRKEHVHPETEAEAHDLVEAIQEATRAITFGAKPVVGAIHGWAVGGGFEWAINCDFPIWSEDARAFFPEIRLGVFVTGAVTSLLPALVGLQKARELLFLGEQHDASALHAMGLAWRVVPANSLRSEAMAVAQQLAGLPQKAMMRMKRALNTSAVNDIERALRFETEATVAGFLAPETTRRLLAFE
ncbi:enoyl-CoA hydratase/isomerase family protein [Phaeovulum sp.]|uniref:enoyl-CoA hydratase/isomerase family protein n=1 Tax=Phaeovulum sp. TaxID=2934796 RepID=UPI002ABCB093|nr:enoyl-CoA hydratase/isomerase family protein [Phaeovulum sp.]MDZ4120223.1 enoyl-CoA hydratase/isomerase family protein [Phaeovulum sp.]